MYAIIEKSRVVGGIFMSVDILQEKIRKTKNPSVVVFEAFPDWIPPQVQEGNSVVQALEKLYMDLLSQMKGHVGAIRFGFGSFALLGIDGLSLLSRLLEKAKEQGYYVILDAPETMSALAAQNAAALIGAEDSHYPCDGLVISSYLGSDILNSYLALCKQGKSLFAVVRTANRSAPEMQDLLSGGRLVQIAAADIVNRHGQTQVFAIDTMDLETWSNKGGDPRWRIERHEQWMRCPTGCSRATRLSSSSRVPRLYINTAARKAHGGRSRPYSAG